MNPEFVPFSLSRRNGAASNAQPRSASSTTAAPAAQFVPIAVKGPQGAAASTAQSEPQITLERQGDRVTRIKVQCPCGNVIELACEY